MKSAVTKRSVIIDGHQTSVSMEENFWSCLKDIARERDLTLSRLIELIDVQRVEGANLSSAIRMYLIDCVRTQLRDLETGRPSVRLGAQPLDDRMR